NTAKIICKSNVVLGNGKSEGIKNIIFVNPKTFQADKTSEIAKEIEYYNKILGLKKSYILAGPGRWGSTDPWLGIPVNWTQISGAKVIIEIGMEEFPVDPSFGSHFFQNVTGMRIGYFTINHKDKSDSLDIGWILNQKIIDMKSHTLWIETKKPLEVIIDGQTGKGNIQYLHKAIPESMDEELSTGI
ncbi:uncharacterized protein METZ01_LOCUS409378, partial [marine metagenome]